MEVRARYSRKITMAATASTLYLLSEARVAFLRPSRVSVCVIRRPISSSRIRCASQLDRRSSTRSTGRPSCFPGHFARRSVQSQRQPNNNLPDVILAGKFAEPADVFVSIYAF